MKCACIILLSGRKIKNLSLCGARVYVFWGVEISHKKRNFVLKGRDVFLVGRKGVD